jgi:hypothetical protein
MSLINLLPSALPFVCRSQRAKAKMATELLATCQFYQRCMEGVFHTAADLERAKAIVARAEQLLEPRE